jgi:hypothetical protein
LHRRSHVGLLDLQASLIPRFSLSIWQTQFSVRYQAVWP